MILLKPEEKKNLWDLIKSNDDIGSGDTFLRKSLMEDCGVGDVCQKIKMDYPASTFARVLCSQLQKIQKQGKPGLILFLENYKIFFSDEMDEHQIALIDSIISKWEKKQTAKPVFLPETPKQQEKKPEIIQTPEPDETQSIIQQIRISDQIKQKQVFISYADEDSQTAKRLYQDLKQAGIPVWMDKESLLPGQRWQIEIKKAVQNSDYFLALLSSNSVSKRGFIQKELKLAFEVLDSMPSSEIFLIPAMIDECSPTDERLKEFHWAKLFPSYENGFSQILRVLCDKTSESR
ncbi:toll/interleukin-1 receptor domain-containing protein [Desulfobacterales bacterium HSG17]|nr:toll/interleukin-1 receptor domain-containing protein [Desulfobacterales bacterium HSG17]